MFNDQASVEFVRHLLDSYWRYFERDLVRRQTPEADAYDLFRDELVIVAHEPGTNPYKTFVYGNDQALELWAVGWNQLMVTPSRMTTPAEHQAERQQAFDEVAVQGFKRGYPGIRQTLDGRQFRIVADIWKVSGPDGEDLGLAAAFPKPTTFF